MRISAILNEGTIKVPREAIKDVMNTVCTDVFSRAFTYITRDKVRDNYPELVDVYKALYREYQKDYGSFPVHLGQDESKVMTQQVHVRMKEVDPRYFKRNPNAKNRTYTVNVMVHLGDDRGFGGSFTKSTPGRPAKLDVYLPEPSHFERTIRAPELFDSMMERLVGYVEHELMHGIQSMALKQDDSEVAHYYDADEKLIPDKYYTSEIEFGPQVVTAAKEFVASLREFRALGVDVYGKEKIRQLLIRYVNPATPDMAGMETMRSDFFKTLYNQDKEKWKKAVKYFYGLVQDKI